MICKDYLQQSKLTKTKKNVQLAIIAFTQPYTTLIIYHNTYYYVINRLENQSDTRRLKLVGIPSARVKHFRLIVVIF